MKSIAKRLLTLRGNIKQGDFAKKLKINPNTLRNYENGRALPNQEVLERICVEFSVSSDWLLLGRGPMLPGDTQNQEQPEKTPTTPEPAMTCAWCANLTVELEKEREERREVSRENRELSTENRMLWKENGDLRERCTKLEERLIHSSSDVVFFKDLGILSNDTSADK